MSDVRHDPLTNTWVVMAPERLQRPGAHPLPSSHPDVSGDLCPFCAGNEDLTPSEILVRRGQGLPNDRHWTLRVIPNRFPALKVEPQMKKCGVGLYDWVAGVGAHEVLIESPRHKSCAWELSEDELQASFVAVQHRLMDLRRDFRLLSLVYFKNQGAAAGATIAHTHAQILALPMVTPQLQYRLENGKKYQDFHGRCGYCDRLEQEMREGRRIIWSGQHVVAYAPYVSPFPFYTLFQPRRHEACFEKAGADILAELSRALHAVVLKFKTLLDRPALQWILHTAPLQERCWDEMFDWHLELRPILYPLGGVEWGGGVTINPVLPEVAAEGLRSEGIIGT